MRFSEISSLAPGQMDFEPRERRAQVGSIVRAFFAVALLTSLIAYLPAFDSISPAAPFIAIVLTAILCLVVVRRQQINLDLVMATEYQNMLFSTVLSLGCSFIIIVRRDGTIVHASDGISNIFPNYSYGEAQALEGVFEQGVVRRVDRERILAAIHSHTSEYLIFPIFDKYSEKKEYVLTVDPLPRPAGFSVIRAREYLGVRSGSMLLPDVLRSTSVDKLDHLLSSTGVALYTTDPFGRFEYVNPAFEQLFGYEPGAVLASKLHVHHLVFSLGNQVLTEEYSLNDYTGEATIAHRSGTRYGVNITQQLLRDANGKLVGATGSITGRSA